MTAGLEQCRIGSRTVMVRVTATVHVARTIQCYAQRGPELWDDDAWHSCSAEMSVEWDSGSEALDSALDDIMPAEEWLRLSPRGPEVIAELDRAADNAAASAMASWLASAVRCSCGEHWPSIERARFCCQPVGWQSGDGTLLELADCPACHSTITISVRRDDSCPDTTRTGEAP